MCRITRWIEEPEAKAFDMVGNFIFIILTVNSEVHGINMLEDFITQLFQLYLNTD